VNATQRAMRIYLVECYSPGIARDDVEAAGERAIEVATSLRDEGCSVEYVGAILVPADEAVFHVFTSACVGAVREASVRAAVPFERVVESVAIGSLQLGRATR
jgi:hypothetical protein